MADVNLLFTSPIRSVTILFYGLIQQIGTSLLLGLFILYQYGWLHGLYGITSGFLFVILLGYAITLFCAQLTAMVIYSITSSDERRTLIFKGIFVVILGAMALYLFLTLMRNEKNILPTLVEVINGSLFRLVPMGGWMMTAVASVSLGDAPALTITLLATALYIAAMVIIIIKLRSDYYEDVLKATEISFSAITSKKEGRIGEALPQRVKVGSTGIKGGFGANAIYYKHKVENRRAKKILLDIPTFAIALVVVIFAFFTRDIGIIGIFIFSTYMQLFSISMGRWVKELLLPYIYMIPEPPFKKLLNLIRGELPRLFLEGLIIYIPIAFILELSPIEAVFCIAARISFGYLFMAGNFLVDRVYGTVQSKGIIFIFYVIAVILLALPGIIIGAILMGVGVSVASKDGTMLLSIALINALVSMLTIYGCRDVLQYAELNNR